jgi:iron(III) transport system substrate-binding protein
MINIFIACGDVARNAPHGEAAGKFREYLASDEAQGYFANGNNEWPAVPAAVAKNPALESLGKFKAENISIAVIGKNQIAAQKIVDRAGYK